MTGTKSCVVCGAEFAMSAADTTVKCPDCRAARRARRGSVSRSEFYAVKAAEAKSRGYAARRAGDTAAYEAAVADLRHWQAAAGRAA